MSAHDDLIVSAIAPELAVAAGVERALRWQSARMSGDANLALRWQQAQADLALAKREFTIWKPRRAAQMLSIGLRGS